MTEGAKWWVLRPDGKPLPWTISQTAENAMAKAMMADAPAGCRVVRARGEQEDRS